MRISYADFAVLFILFVFSSCHQKQVDLQEIEITPILEIEYFSDSIFFIDVRSIDVDKHLYVLDSEVDRIFVFDLEGNHQETFGVHGRGPTELFEAIQLKAFHDTLTVYSSGKGSFQRFCHGAFVDEIPIPTDLGQFIGFRFTVVNNHLYFTPFNGEGSVVAVNINNPEMFSVFGTMIPSEHPRRKLFQNSRLVLSFDDQIITVARYLTHIERYTLDGKLLERFDLKDLALYRGRLEYIEAFPLAENQIIDLAVDAFIYHDKLFILPFLNMGEKVYTNRVIQFCLASQPMVAEKVYNLGEGGFSTIAVKNNYLWAFRRGWSPAIVKYVLE